MSVGPTIDAAVNDHLVVVFSKSWCAYCAQAKRLLSSLGVEDLHIVEIDLSDNEEEQQAYLHKKTGQRTVPNIFINRKHIGGNSDLQALNRDGKLKGLLSARL